MYPDIPRVHCVIKERKFKIRQKRQNLLESSSEHYQLIWSCHKHKIVVKSQHVWPL